MKLEKKDFYFTLDWDNIDITEAKMRFIRICGEEPVYKVALYLSALSGWHIEAWTFKPIIIALIRKRWGDDGNRLVHDLIDRCDSNVHDVLWQIKYVGPNKFYQREVSTWHR